MEAADGLDAVVKVKDLATAGEFVLNGLFERVIVVLAEEGFNREAVVGRGLNKGKVASASEGEVEGAGDGGGTHGEDVNEGAEVLDLFFVGNAEALFFIDDEETEVFEVDIFC